MNSEKIKEILNAYNKFWTTGLIEAGIERTVLADCLRQIFAKSFGAAAGGENLILTNDLEGEITVGSDKVRSLPVIKFLCGWG